MAGVPGKPGVDGPLLRDRLYALLEHDHPTDSAGLRFARMILAVIVIDVLAGILALFFFQVSFPWLEISFIRELK